MPCTGRSCTRKRKAECDRPCKWKRRTPPTGKKTRRKPAPATKHLQRRLSSVRKRAGKVQLPRFCRGESQRFRLALHRLLDTGQLTMTQCDLFGNLARRQIKVKERTSSSPSIQIFGRYDVPKGAMLDSMQDRLVYKIGFKSWHPHEDNSLEVERRVYRYVTNPLIKRCRTPHVMLMVAEASCNDFKKQFSDLWYSYKDRGQKVPKYIRDFFIQQDSLMHDKNFQGSFDFNEMEVLVLEQGLGGTFERWMRGQRSLMDYMEVFLQVIYTLAAFNEVGLQQNDLHLSNVWVDELPEKRWVYYGIGRGRYVKVQSRWNVKIYDFDRSTKYATQYNRRTITNTALTSWMCGQFGACNTPPRQPKYDAARFLTGCFNQLAMWHRRRTPRPTSKQVMFQVISVIKMWIKDPLILLPSCVNPDDPACPWVHNYSGTIICFKPVDDKNCQLYIPTDAQMMSNHQMLASLAQRPFKASVAQVREAVAHGVPYYALPSVR